MKLSTFLYDQYVCHHVDVAVVSNRSHAYIYDVRNLLLIIFIKSCLNLTRYPYRICTVVAGGALQSDIEALQCDREKRVGDLQ